MIADVWHTQLRLVAKYFPAMQLRPLRTTQDINTHGEVFIYVSPSVDRRETRCPPDVAKEFTDRGYIIIHVQEPRE